jgi:hypothetical protein
MGIVKLALVTPATMRVAIPHEVLLMKALLPFSISATGLVDHARVNGVNFQGRAQRV